ncbi:pyrroline-5-carboxylate reductase [Altererythrobacter confluentis]|uniref:Pyrroline-5-carboxylate reductase n=1 Tax=Allopontixanthobacter confluentis TaxID=1849021 RepID=A0A6L7GBQ3_9SPHN|nr:pyrroline-5-carboxylate reductase dimerization domain-containing protein [Allopontixanthobacter confluentis]MXP13492.1 pyrroline-5-carboxylate reductase [Allopontixanthobacter confluentis]
MPLEKILIVGFGTMAQAMVDGWMAAGIPASRFAIYHPGRSDDPRGIAVHNVWPASGFDAVLLAVKPQKLAEISQDLEPLIGPQCTLVSVLAGAGLDSLAQIFPRAGGIVRLMPNLACAINKSANALVASGLQPEVRAEVTKMAQLLGSAEWLADEAQFDLVAALAGSGPAFVYRFIDALAAAATGLGLDQTQAERLALIMVEGAAALAASSDHSPAELARRVASPGGMTQKGLDVLDENQALQSLLLNCLAAARDRGAEMAADARKQG